jgi:protein involved in polysaccharide export with SLBB domain
VRSVVRPLWLVVILLLVACATRQTRPPVVVPPAEPDTALGPGDSFEVSVYGQTDLSGKYRVDEDGSINFPLVGKIEIAGKAPGAIASDIRAALVQKEILRDPNV